MSSSRPSDGRVHALARNARRRWLAGRIYARQLLARVDRLARPGAWPKKQIIICGPPRSGTSLLYNMMATALPEFGRSPFETSAHEHIMKTRHYLSKRPLDILEVHALPRRNVFAKELHVVVVVRDPRDVVTSVHPNVPHDYFIGWDSSYFVGPAYPYAPALRSPGLSAIAAAFEEVQRVPGLNVVVVRYEQLTADPDAVQRRLSEALGVKYNARFADFHTRKDLLPYRYEGRHRAVDPDRVREDRPVDGARVGKWRAAEHAVRIHEQFSRHPELLALVRRWGYEESDDWFDAFRDRPGAPVARQGA